MIKKNALITLNYNDYKQTIEFVNSICTFKLIDFIIIVDNASSNNSLEQLTQYKIKNKKWKKVDLICCSMNKGYAKGNNYGMKYAIEKYAPYYLMISNPDVLFNEEIIIECINTIENSEKKVGVTAPLMNSLGQTRSLCAWKLPNKWNIYLNNFMLIRRYLHLLEYKDSYFENPKSIVDVLPGSLLFSKSDTMIDINFFDEDTFLYGEENILAYKLKEKGYINILINNMEYTHIHGKTINNEIKSIKKRFDLCLQGYMIYIKKYLKIKCLGRIFFIITYKCGVFNYILLSRFKKS